jgi:predicted phage terminase large subunit-like protein
MPDGGSALSLATQVALLPPDERARILASLDPASLLYDWNFWARPDQLPPAGDWQFWGNIAGRGSGKTRSGSEWVRKKVRKGTKPTRGALVAATAGDGRDIMVEGPAGLLSVFPPHERPIYEPSKRKITFPSNGSVALLFSAEEPERLRGPNHHWSWCDEVGSWKYQVRTWDMLQFGLRLGDNPQCLVTTTPRPTPVLRELVSNALGMTVITRSSTYANKGNLAGSFLRKMLLKYEGTNLGRQELMGELINDTPGALWTRGLIESNRIGDPKKVPPMQRIVIGVDPPATSGKENQDMDKLPECGIVVAGKGIDGHAYVWEDASLTGTPDEWGKEVNGVYQRYRADRVIAEVNQGGEMVEYVIRTVNKSISYTGVHASKGKITRAEPIAALYEQGRVHHIGMHGPLEDQMTTYVPGNKSPDRMDALVWALTELMLDDNLASDFAPHIDIEPSNWRIS